MAGYSGTPLAKKLGLMPAFRLYVFNPPDDYFDWLSPLDPEITFTKRLAGSMDFIHVFTKHRKQFEEQFRKCRNVLTPSGMLWISWPKKASKVPTDLDENIIRNFGLANGMVDVKVCAVDEIWSGLKFVFRSKDRKQTIT